MQDAGKISHELAQELAEKEYDKFNVKRLKAEASADGDFEKAIRLIEEKESLRATKERKAENFLPRSLLEQSKKKK